MKEIICLVSIYFLGSVAGSFSIKYDAEELGDPLILTPFIENGDIIEAQEKALVHHEEMANVKSYAGYVTIDKRYNSNMFFWYFPSHNNSKHAPLMLWMTGGPGVSSLFALFGENGPFSIQENWTLEKRNYSWHTNHNMVYIDNPVGSGFSFTNDSLGYAKNETDIGIGVLNFLKQFYKIFPELRKNNLFVAGESYAGKYVSAVSYTIKLYNEKAKYKINLKGLSIGNGVINLVKQHIDRDLLFRLGLVDSNGYRILKEVENKIKLALEQNNNFEAIMYFDNLLFKYYTSGTSMFQNLTGFQYYYNFLQTSAPENLYSFQRLVKRSDIRDAIHVGNTPFLEMSKILLESLAEDLLAPSEDYIAKLLPNYKVLIYHGQLDLCISYLSTIKIIEELNWSGVESYKKAKRKQWRVKEKLAGYVKTVENLTEVLVRNAGHMVPMDQPEWAFDLITRFTYNLSF